MNKKSSENTEVTAQKKQKSTDSPVIKNEIYEIDIVGLTSEGAGVGKIYFDEVEGAVAGTNATAKNGVSQDKVCGKMNDAEGGSDVGADAGGARGTAGDAGQGTSRSNGFAVFVPFALPGERAKVQIVKALKNYAFGKLLETLSPSPDRVEPKCPVASRCGGCSLQHISYAAQLKLKQTQVVDALRKIGGFEKELEDKSFVVEPTVGMEDPWRYRNKSQMPFARNKDFEIVSGFYRPGSHDIVATESCIIQGKVADRMVASIKEFAIQNKLPIYDEKTGVGLLRHVMTRVGKKTGEIMVVIVITGKGIPNEDGLVEKLKNDIEYHFRTSGCTLQSVIINTNTKSTNVVLGKINRTIFGKDFITDKIGKFTFKISPLSFFQVNTVQTNVLYEKAMEFADLKGGETVIDAYCGAGTISLFLSQKAEKVIGVEIVKSAIADAIENAKINKVENVEFICGEAEKIIPALYKKGVKADVVVVDPPRKGCDIKLLETIVAMEPEKIVYVSCDPSTLARDLKYLAGKGFEVKKAQPVDMFPQTNHIEVVVKLRRQECS